jgi:hypothetical protein
MAWPIQASQLLMTHNRSTKRADHDEIIDAGNLWSHCCIEPRDHGAAYADGEKGLLILKPSRQLRCLTHRPHPTFCRTAPHPLPPVLKPRCNCRRESSTLCELFLVA